MNISIIGAGLIGEKRAHSLPNGINLKLVCDIDEQKGKVFARKFNCSFEKDWRMVVKNKDIDAIFTCVTNNNLAKIAISAIRNGKHTLIEKPGGINPKEISDTYKAFKKNSVVVMYGYNHRFHPAIRKAKQIVDSGKFGPILFIRARYGHGGRLNYEKEWRFNKEIAGGGELLDQGAHLIDLVNFFNGQMELHSGLINRLFWESSLEDSAFVILKKENNMAFLSATCIEWKNIFSFEIMLKTAKIQIDGLGRSYGKEKLTLFVMSPKMGPPEIKEFSFPEEDLSWKRETEIFISKIKSYNYSNQSLKDAYYVLDIIDKVYSKNIT